MDESFYLTVWKDNEGDLEKESVSMQNRSKEEND
jgi:hypothetical protein